MAYKAPVADILFTLNHIAGFSRHLDEGLFGDLDRATVEAMLDEAGRFASRGTCADQSQRRRQRARLKDGEVTLPPGWKEAYRQILSKAGGTRCRSPAEFGGQGLPVARRHGGHRDVERRQYGVRPQSAADPGRRRGAAQIWLRGAEDQISAENGVGRMDRLDAAHRAACRLRSALPEDARRAAGRRHLPHHRHQDLHHLRRASADREHRPHRACPPARRAGRHQGHLDVPGAEIPGQ